ncbi:MAG: FG-GAP-like repeat-containing protein [Crocinitomicaceae bacterium]|nr:FG-GAP-like repeat-containing protein [Crocinitomicaceae bacterium]
MNSFQINVFYKLLIVAFFPLFASNASGQVFKEHIIDLGDCNDDTRIVQGDIDGDGDLDFITFYAYYSVNHTPKDIRLYENKGGNVFERHVLFDRACHYATLGDIDEDGDMDIIASIRTEDKVVYYENLGNFTFSTEKIVDQFCDEAFLVAAGDFDGDGDIDVATGSVAGLNEVSIIFNDGNGNFSNEKLLSSPTKDPIQFIVGDVDNNGIDDLAYRRYQDDDIILYSGTGGGNFNVNAYNGTSSYPVNHFCFLDLEHDSILELAFIDDTEIRVIKDLLGSAVMSLVDNGGNFHHVAGGDIDGDGDDDIILNGGTSTPNIYYINDLSNGGGYIQNFHNSTIPHGADLISGDYDGDGLDDIAYPGSSFSFTGITKFMNFNGGVEIDTTYQLSIEEHFDGFTNPLLYADIDSDGDSDIITKQGWYENYGGGSFGDYQRIIHDTLPDGTDISTHDIVAITDADSDGINDLILESSLSVWYWLKFDASSGEISIPTNVTYNTVDDDLLGRTLIDLDNDGDLDLMGYDNGNFKWCINGFTWFGNFEPGAFDPIPNNILDAGSTTVTGYVEPQSFGDIDNDGDQDLFGLASGDSLYYYENFGNARFSQKQLLINNLPSNTGNIIGTGDMNGDNRIDVLARVSDPIVIPPGIGYGNILVYYANLPGGFTGPHYIDSISATRAHKPFAQWGDVNGDGHNDLFVTFAITTKHYFAGWYKSKGDGTFHDIQYFDNMEITSFPAIADMDGDGDLDLLAYSTLTAKVSWLENLSGECTSCTVHKEENICIGDYVVLGDSIITAEGTYRDTLLSSGGCDSIVVLDVRFTNEFCVTNQCSELIISEYLEGSGNNQAIEIYNPTNASINLNTYSIGVFNGAYSQDSIIPLTGVIYSDSTFVIGNINATLSGILNKSSLLSSKLVFSGNDAIVLYKDGHIIDRVGGEIMNHTVITEGSLSTQDQTLVRLPSITSGLVPNATDSLSYQFSGLATDDTTNLLIHTSHCQQYLCNTYVTIDSSICAGDSVFVFQDTLTQTGIYTDTLTNSASCDSIVTLRLISSSNHTFLYDTICAGDTLFYNGDTLTTQGVYLDTLMASSGCDSLVVMNLHTTSLYADFSGLATTYMVLDSADTLVGDPVGGIFSGSGISGNTFNPTTAGVGTHTVTYTYSYGSCLGIKQQNVTVTNCTVSFSGLGNSYTTSNAPVTLAGDPVGGTFSGLGISGNTFNPSVAGVGTHDIVYTYNAGGCSGTDTQTVTVTGAPTYNYELIISAVYDGPLSGGTPKGIELFVAQDIADLSLFGIGSANNGGGTDGEEFTFPAVAATAGSYIYIASESTQFNNFLGFAPDYTDGSIGINGDDAIELFKSNVVIDVFGDINIDGTGQPWEYLDGWASRDSCSLPNNGTFTISEWNFSGINALDGEATNSTSTTPIPIGIFACPPPCTPSYGTDMQTTCDSYTWMDGNTYTSSNNTATYSISNGAASGCDSIVTLNLVINQSSSSTDIIQTCGSNYTWIDGNTYTTSNNTATHTITNAAGCDSVITLNLTFGTPNTGTDIIIACNSYTWIDGNTYTTNNNTATYTLTNTAGCDSIVTLNLTFGTPNTGTDVITACSSHTWIDGNTYTSSNSTATHTLTNAAGCDSIVTLNLTINLVNSSVTQAGMLLTADETGATYQWLNCPGMSPISGATNQSFTAPENGNYAVIVTNNGCSDTSTCYTVTTTGIIENNFGDKLLLYPNPTDGLFSVDLGEIHTAITITISNLNGKLIQSTSYSKGQLLNLNLEEPAGVYLLMIESREKKAIIRLVKE